MDVWGDKPESQISARLILEAIADLIAAHNDDPDAHLEVGQSLQSHKASEIIDHLANSIVSDKLEEYINITATGIFNRDDFHWFTVFESVDGYDTVGSVVPSGAGLYLTTAATTDAVAALTKSFESFFIPLVWTKKRRFKTAVFLANSTYQDIWIICGGDIDDYPHFGFKIINLHLYATVADGAGESTLDLGNITQSNHVFEAFLDPGVDCEFFVDGVSVGTITTNLPGDGDDGPNYIVQMLVKAGSNSAREITVFSFDFWQEN